MCWNLPNRMTEKIYCSNCYLDSFKWNNIEINNGMTNMVQFQIHLNFGVFSCTKKVSWKLNEKSQLKIDWISVLALLMNFCWEMNAFFTCLCQFLFTFYVFAFFLFCNREVLNIIVLTIVLNKEILLIILLKSFLLDFNQITIQSNPIKPKTQLAS